MYDGLGFVVLWIVVAVLPNLMDTCDKLTLILGVDSLILGYRTLVQWSEPEVSLKWVKWAWSVWISVKSLHWRHNDHDGVSNHQPHGCLLNRLFRRRSQKTSKLRVTGLCTGPVNSPHNGPVTKKMFPFDDIIMMHRCVTITKHKNT